jgi:putative nucleotidyltransferase with HDIG domain
MSKFLLFIRTNLTTLILYVAALIFVLLLYPVEGRFPYEFQQGKPWMHQDLYAPFDIPLLKTSEELRMERDSVLRDTRPYYNVRQGADSLPLAQFDQTVREQWPQWPEAERDSLISRGKRLLAAVYARGVYQATEGAPLHQYCMLIRNKIAEQWELSDLFTPRQAYEFVVNDLKAQLPPEQISFVRSLNLNAFIVPNLEYNPDASRNYGMERLRNLSLTKGILPAGQRLIGRNEMVNKEMYNRLLSYKQEFESRMGVQGNLRLVLLGQFVLLLFPFLVLYLFLFTFRRTIHQSFKDTLFILLMLSLMVGVACLTVRYSSVSLYLLPYALLPMVLRTFFDSRLAFFVHVVSVVLISPLVPNSFEFAFLQLVAGFVAIVSLKTIDRRSTLFMSVVWILGSYWAIHGALQLMHGYGFGEIVWIDFMYLLVSAALVTMAYPLIFLFEKVFGYLSDVSLMELSDANHPVLRKLAEVAPGTFQHSMQVANLAEEVVRKIGGNPLLVRTGAMYHDIGKTVRPMYYIENLSSHHSPHDNIPTEESARIIIEHVSRGVEYARKSGLPEKIIDFIRTHHGTTTVRFFLYQYQKQHPSGGLDRSRFTYPGPAPFSKETVALMICDSVEAASRSLKEFNRKTIHDLVDKVVQYQVEEEQYVDADVTYRDINIAKNIVKKKLMNIYHVRVEYPEMERVGDTGEQNLV